MTQFQDIRPGSVAIPKAQTIIKAAHLSSTKEDADSWPVVGGVKSKDGWALCDGSTYDPLIFPDLDKNLGFPASKVLPNGPYRTRALGDAELTFNSQPAGWAVRYAEFIFYTDNAGKWRLKYNLGATISSTAGRIFVGIDGVDFNGSSATFNQATSAVSVQTGQNFSAAEGDTNAIAIELDSPRTYFLTSGDVALASKPTIANFDDYLESYPIIAVNDNVTSSSIGLPEIGAEQPGLPTLDQIAEGNRNYIINGGFDFWQRGTSQTDNGYSSADRFFFSYGTTTKTISQQSFSAGQTEVGSNPKYYTESAIASGNTASSYGQSFQKIEGVDTLQGDIVTLSFYAKADTSKNMSTEFVQGFGTGGSPSADVFGIGVKKYALTTSWQKFTVTTTIPSIAGKTLGTNGDDYLRVNFWLDAGSDFDSRTDSLGNQSGTFDIAQVKLEQGTQATKFTRAGVTYAGELALCQRYYEKGYALFYGAAGGRIGSSVQFSVKKRDVSSIFYSEDFTDPDITSVSFTTTKALESFNWVSNSGLSVGDSYQFSFYWQADAEL